MAHAGIPTLIDASHAVVRNKVMIIDNETVIIRSFNFTRAAEEKNAENLLTIRDKALAERYTKNCQEHAAFRGVHGKGKIEFIASFLESSDSIFWEMA